MKRYLLWLRNAAFSIILITASSNCKGQDLHLANPDPQQLAFTDLNDSKGFRLFSASRLNTNKSNTDVQNLFKQNWSKGVVQFRNGKQYRDALLNFDLVKNELFFNNNNKRNLFADPVSGFILIDSTNGNMTVDRFNNGYPSFGTRNELTFYQVLAFGKNVHLLKHFTKYVVEKQRYNEMTTFNYKIVEDYYVYDVLKRELHFVKPAKSSLAKALPAYEANISALALPKKLSESNMITMMDTINNN